MAQVGNVLEINEVKDKLETLKHQGLISAWELPYENILTRLTAAVFFVSADEANTEKAWEELAQFPRMHYQKNEDKTLSALPWRVEFNKDFEL